MRLFKISGKFEQDGEWSKKENDFIGYFVKRNERSDVIEGYVEEQYETSYDKIRFIKGLYMEDMRQLVFLQMINDRILSPLLYAFTDIRKDGFWDMYRRFGGFFFLRAYQGHARIEVKEITDEKEKDELVEQTIRTFEEKSSVTLGINRDLMEGTDALTDFLHSMYYPEN